LSEEHVAKAAFESSDGSFEPPPVLTLASAAPQALPRSAAPLRALGLVAFAAAITVVFGTRYVRAHGTTAAAAPVVETATLVEVAKVEATPERVQVAAAYSERVQAPASSSDRDRERERVQPRAPSPDRERERERAAPSRPPAAALSTPLRRAPAPRARLPAALGHQPCVGKLDPATGKTVYKGDCD